MFRPRFLNLSQVYRLFQELSAVTSYIASLGTKPWISLMHKSTHSYCGQHLSTVLRNCSEEIHHMMRDCQVILVRMGCMYRGISLALYSS